MTRSTASASPFIASMPWRQMRMALRYGSSTVIGLLLATAATSTPAPDLSKANVDFHVATALAWETGKDNLVIFTGLEWEPWSRKLRDETLNENTFLEALATDFVVTFINLPKVPKEQEKLSELERQHYQLAQNFRLHSFPSIYLCTSDGRPYDLVGYLAGGPESVLAAIRTRKASYARLAEDIEKLKGPPLASAIDAWLKTLPEFAQSLHPEKIEIVLAADPENKTGLRPKYKMATLLPKAREARYTGKLDEAEALYLQILQEAEPKGEELQTVLYEFGDVFLQRHDYGKLLAVLDRAIKAAPTSKRMPVLNEMVDVFTHRWIYLQCRPDLMKAADYDYKKVNLSAADRRVLLELVHEAKKIAPDSLRNEILDQIARASER